MVSTGLGSGDSEDRSPLAESPVSLGGQLTISYTDHQVELYHGNPKGVTFRDFLSEVSQDFKREVTPKLKCVWGEVTRLGDGNKSSRQNLLSKAGWWFPRRQFCQEETSTFEK